MQFTRTFIPREVFSCKLPWSRTSSSPSNCTMVSGWTVTVDPSASIFAQLPFWVCTRSCRKIAEELGAGFPFSHTPPSSWSIARAEFWAISDVGKMTIITPQTSLRHSSKQTPPLSSRTACARITCGALASY